jgi:hypothetical protein
MIKIEWLCFCVLAALVASAFFLLLGLLLMGRIEI